MTKYSIIMLYLLLGLVYAQNLICNGNFEGYKLSLTYYQEPYSYINSNSSCWFNKNGGQVEIKKKLKPPATSTAELSLQSAYTLCQFVTLEIGKKYQLNFTVVNGWTMSYSTIIVDVSGVWVMNLTALNQFTIARGSQKFVANRTANRICFDPRFTIKNMILYPFIGPCIDNVTLVKVIEAIPTPPPAPTPTPSPPPTQTNSTTTTQNTSTNSSSTSPSPSNSTSSPSSGSTNFSTSGFSDFFNQSFTSTSNQMSIQQIVFFLYCKTFQSDSEEKISIDCTYDDVGIDILVEIVKNDIEIYIEGQYQSQVSITTIEKTYLNMTIYPRRSYNLKMFSIALPEEVLKMTFGTNYKFIFTVDGYNLVFCLLEKEEINTVQEVYPVSEFVMSVVQKIYTILKASFFSYFLLDIISFWNVSLMYNFLNISTVPLFSKYFLEKLERIIFKLNSIVEWAASRIPGLKDRLGFEEISGRELIPDYEYRFAWFGFFGISSNYMKSNIEQLVLIGLLLFKLGLLTLIKRAPLLPRFLKHQLPSRLKKLQILLNEMIGIQIFMVVSAAGTLRFFGFFEVKQKINTIIQVIALFSGILTVPFYFLIQIEREKKKLTKKSVRLIRKLEVKSHKNISSIRKSIQTRKKNAVITAINDVLEFVPFVTIPFLVIFDNSAIFLAAHTFIFGFRFWWVWRHLRIFEINVLEKMFLVLNLTVWIVHHGAYLVFWTIEKVGEFSGWSSYSAQIFECIKICGFTTIFTVIVGGLLELLRFCASTLLYFFKTIKKIFLRQRKIHDQQSVKLQNLRKSSGVRQENGKKVNKRQVAIVKNYEQKMGSDDFAQKFAWNRIKIQVHFKKQRARINTNRNALQGHKSGKSRNKNVLTRKPANNFEES